MPTNDFAPDRRLFLLSALGASAALAGCSNVLGPPDTPRAIYLLAPPVAPASGGAPAPWALTIDTPEATDSIDSQRIAITKADGTLDYYANAMWPDRAPLLVQTALLAAFQGSGRIRAVARAQDALHADYELITDMRDFSAHYSQPDGIPDVTVTLVAQMVTARGRQVVANFTASRHAAASANSVAAAVEAFNAAMAAAAGDIVNWALALPPPA